MADIEKQIDDLCESKDLNGDYMIEFIERNPHISAFRTKSVPDYLKVGYTDRPVSVRLKDWGTKYEEIEPVGKWLAKVKSEKVPENERYSTHDNSSKRAPQFDEADFSSLEAKLPEWIEETLKKAREKKNDKN